ncbi:MAG: ParB/RepB/Spo0J family partition protein [Acidobacteria bacterium]|nr:ParB/RepB/Spo0J family partition protein [Acidobacteriota bacterium]
MEVVQLQIAKIDTRKYRLREAAKDAVPKLAASVEKVGLLHPLTVCKRKDGKYDLVSGHVRFEALKERGEKTAPAVVIPADEKALQTALVENFARTDLNPLEKARALHKLEGLNMSRKEIAELLGVTPPQVTNLLALFSLEPEVQKAIDKGEIQFGHAKALLALKGQRNLQLKALKAIREMMSKENKASARTVESLVRSLKAEAEGADAPELGLKLPKHASIQDKGKGKRLLIDFKDMDDLKEALTELMEHNFNK